MAVKLRRVVEATTAISQFAPELVELLDKNWFDVESALNSVGAVAGTPGGGSGGVNPGGTISHHNLLDLTTFDDHPQYLKLDWSRGTQTLTWDFPLGTEEVFNIQDTNFGTPSFKLLANGNIFIYDQNNWVIPGGVPLLIDARVRNIAWGDEIVRFSTGQVNQSSDVRALTVGRDGIRVGARHSDNFQNVFSVRRSEVAISGNAVDEYITMRQLGSANLLGIGRNAALGNNYRVIQFYDENPGGIDLPDSLGNCTVTQGSYIVTSTSNAVADGMIKGDLLTDSTYFYEGTRVLDLSWNGVTSSIYINRPAKVNAGPVTLNYQSDILTYIDNQLNYIGPVIADPLYALGTSIIDNASTYKATAATYTSGTLGPIVSVGNFGLSEVGQTVIAPGVPIGSKITSRSNDQIFIDKLLTANGPNDVYYGFGNYHKLRQSNQFWKFFGDAEVDTVTTYSVNRKANEHFPFIPTLNYPNVFTTVQKFISDGSYCIEVVPSGGVPWIWLDDGIGNPIYRVLAGQVLSNPDLWYQSGPGTPKLTHVLAYTEGIDRTATWPDVSGTVVLSPAPLENLNTSANVTGGVVHTNTGSNKYFRVNFYLATRTAGDRSAVLTLKWTDNIGAKTLPLPTLLLTSGNKITPAAQTIFVASGNITYDLTFTGTTGTADIRAIVERMN